MDAPLPRILTFPASAPATLVAQGAEARVYRTSFLTPDRPCALKFRPPKAYRHPVLDARLTRQRILAEARILNRCRRDGVPVPALYAVDVVVDDEGGGDNGGSDGGGDGGRGSRGGSLLTEWIDGAPVRARLNAWLDERADVASDTEVLLASPDLLSLMRRIGSAVGSLHRVGIVHGDLTTSNLMLRPPAGQMDGQTDGQTDGSNHPKTSLDGDIVVIDFGLASQSTSDEDRAVDLYVLERAFGSTHPRAEGLFAETLRAYQDAFKQAKPVLRKLEDVRMRGRKRSMLG